MEQSETKQKKKSISISKWFPYFPAFAVTLGVIRLMIFYESFNIQVLPFLDVSEVILSFMDVLFPLVFGTLWQMIQVKFSSPKESKEYRKNFKKFKSEKKPERRLIIFLKNHWTSITILSVCVACLYIATIISASIPIYMANFTAIGAGCLLIYILIATIIEVRLDETDAPQEHRELMYLATNGMLCIGLVIGIASFQGKELKEAKKHQVVFIELNDKSIILTNDNYYYVGRTKGYIFLYSTTDERTDVIASEEIRSMKFYSRNRKNR